MLSPRISSNHNVIDFGLVVIVLWFWWIPPFIMVEWTKYEKWEQDYDEYPGRRLRYSKCIPCVEKMDKDEYQKIRNRQFPQEPLNRTASWEGFPGVGWAKVKKNKRVYFLRMFNGTSDGIERARKEYMDARDATNIMLGLLAAVGAAALAIPGIETTHWLTRAFWISSTVTAVCGVLVGGLLPGLFQLFFGDDMELCHDAAKVPEPVDKTKLFSLKTNAALMHEVDKLFAMPTLSVTYSGALFIAGSFAFVCTADFAANARSYSKLSKIGLGVVAMAPSVLYMLHFWFMMFSCSVRHRRFRRTIEEEDGPSIRDGAALSPQSGAGSPNIIQRPKKECV